jgi:hypothetical protein
VSIEGSEQVLVNDAPHLAELAFFYSASRTLRRAHAWLSGAHRTAPIR